MARFEHHLFVCENTRPAGHPRGCCQERGGVPLRAHLKAALKKRGLQGMVRANAAGCLDQCERGATVVVYPEGVWYGGVTEADVEEILDGLEQGQVVERLRIPDDELTGRARPSDEAQDHERPESGRVS